MSVQDTTTDVLQVTVVLQSTLEKTLLLTKTGNLGTIILVPLLHLQNSLSHLRSSHQIVLQHLCLPDSIFRLVLDHTVYKESSHLFRS